MLLFSGSWENTIKMWCTDNRKVIRIFIGHTDEVRSIAINLDIKYIVSGSYDYTIKIWNISSGQAKNTLIGH